MNSFETYSKAISAHLEAYRWKNEPKNLYEPARYILGLGGKRLRPVLTLLAAESFGIAYSKALDAALAVEFFHNFSLIHDDIMDEAPLRRGAQTVHLKWSRDIAILSGDTLFSLAYNCLESYDEVTMSRLTKIINRTAVEVYEGQQMDMDFETQKNVSIDEYKEMIRRKTAVLMGAALEMGAVVANASETNRKLICDFGIQLGLAFQLQDDYLDAFGNPATFGKQVGGDILENKKTFLYLKAIGSANKEQVKQLEYFFNHKNFENAEKIEAIKNLYLETGATTHILKEIEQHTQTAFEAVDKLNISNDSKQLLKNIGKLLMGRNN
ncbi:MAG: polyprenyl synthetase [Flavobacteriales bacterium CG_4_9_14_3_um_filter_40_17]|nr:MAG: polyprenyl synthetase [Flavobacteriales bacterium CG_4_9_14_3_um_filter_40_17]